MNKQDFNNAITQDIEMVKGDTLSFNFQLQGLEGAEPSIYFTCREHYNDDAPLFVSSYGYGIALEEYDEESDLATYSVRVDPIKTKSLNLGRYYYDLELRYGDDVLTLMRGRLSLVYEVTRG